MENNILKKENEELKQKIKDLEEHLKKYTNGNNRKRYYEKNKDKFIANGAEYLAKLKEENPEKLKEYRRTAYQNYKAKKEKEILEQLEKEKTDEKIEEKI
jgi:hypothetical protein